MGARALAAAAASLALLAAAAPKASAQAELPPPGVLVHAEPPYASPAGLTAIACPSAGLCLAGDHAGDIAVSRGPAARSWHLRNVDGSTPITALSCASASLCLLGDGAGDIGVSTAPAAHAPAWHISHVAPAPSADELYPSVRVTGLSCPGAALCVAVDNRGDVLTSTDPGGGAPAWATTAVDGTIPLTGLSCSSPQFCAAVDLAGDLVYSADPLGGAAAWHVEALPGLGLTAFPARLDGDFPSAVSCSRSACVVATRGGELLASSTPASGAAGFGLLARDLAGGLEAVSCAPGPWCRAVDAHGQTLSSATPASGGWQGAAAGTRAPLTAVSCPVAELCAATDSAGEVISLDGAGRQLQRAVDARGSSPCFGGGTPGLGRLCAGAGLSGILPVPAEAQITPNAPCAVVDHRGLAQLCAFGVPPERATATFALLGDSHAQHWRAALEVVAQANSWQGISVTQSGCPFSAGPLVIAGAERRECRQMMLGDVVAWLRAQPEIETVFVSQSGLSVPHRTPGALRRAVRGYLSAWAMLPASVRHVIVIRDNPRVSTSTLACLEAQAEAHRAWAGRTCSVPRASALGPDPAALAAAQLPGGRAQVIDLTSFMCDARRCYPVVGGALVYKDFQHLTEVFATTLGPFLRGRIRALHDGLPEG